MDSGLYCVAVNRGKFRRWQGHVNRSARERHQRVGRSGQVTEKMARLGQNWVRVGDRLYRQSRSNRMPHKGSLTRERRERRFDGNVGKGRRVGSEARQVTDKVRRGTRRQVCVGERLGWQ